MNNPQCSLSSHPSSKKVSFFVFSCNYLFVELYQQSCTSKVVIFYCSTKIVVEIDGRIQSSKLKCREFFNSSCSNFLMIPISV